MRLRIGTTTKSDPSLWGTGHHPDNPAESGGGTLWQVKGVSRRPELQPGDVGEETVAYYGNDRQIKQALPGMCGAF
jgi:hypothetical protein